MWELLNDSNMFGMVWKKGSEFMYGVIYFMNGGWRCQLFDYRGSIKYHHIDGFDFVDEARQQLIKEVAKLNLPTPPDNVELYYHENYGHCLGWDSKYYNPRTDTMDEFSCNCWVQGYEINYVIRELRKRNKNMTVKFYCAN